MERAARQHDNDNQPVRYGPWLPTKALAKACGSKHFFTGKPCGRGHIAPKLTSNGSCMDCHNLRCGRFNKMKRQLDDEWRECENEKKRALYHLDPTASYERSKEWRAANSDYLREYNTEYMRERRAADPTINEQAKESMRLKRLDEEYVAAERERERERYAQDPTKHLEKSRRYAKENPERAAMHARNRRARLKESEGEHTTADIERLLGVQGYKCASCNKSVRNGYDVDHIKPISKGGSNWPSNLQILCPTCNRQKNNLDPLEFARRKGRLV